MTAVYFNSKVDDDSRRLLLYRGELFVYTASASTQALCDHARQLCEEAFAPHDPREAQFHLPTEQYVEILAKLKLHFIHHPESKRLIQLILTERGCDLHQTFFDVPRLRTVTHGGYLTSGLGYAFKPHRDTWYSTPMCQLNWWLPIYPIESDNAMAFHPHYWNRAIENTSAEFNYQEWQQTGRKHAAKHVNSDNRRQSEATEPLELEPELRVVTEPSGLLIFSPAHLHSTVPNTAGETRLSIDFRTVHLGDLHERTGAPNIDSACTGTTIHDYLRGIDLEHLPESVIASYEHAAAMT